MRAVVIEKEGEDRKAPQTVALKDFPEDQLMEGDVTLRVSHSTLNYKDALAITGKSPIARRFPMIPGIDMAGTVETSDHPGFKPGDAVLLNGWGVGETHLGGYAEKARVKGDWLLKLPDGFSPEQAMAVGTAGYTAALSVLALNRHGLKPSDGPAVVTGASGGVGSIATALLAKAGWEVLAVTGKAQEEAYLKKLGAFAIVPRDELSGEGRPLAKERWAAGVDSVGSKTLANVLAGTKRDGAIAACGLAQGPDLPATVMPFILRGVSLLGIDSVMAPKEKRQEAWDLLDSDLDRGLLAEVTADTVALDKVIDAASDLLKGKIRGRVVVEVE